MNLLVLMVTLTINFVFGHPGLVRFGSKRNFLFFFIFMLFNARPSVLSYHGLIYNEFTRSHSDINNV